jgi:single-strand DNA-binding protein
MAQFINAVRILGTIDRAPQLFNADPNKTSFANVSVKTVKKGALPGQQFDSFHPVVVFGENAELVGTCHPGAEFDVRGELRTRKFTGRDGSDRYRTEVIVSDRDPQHYLKVLSKGTPVADDLADAAPTEIDDAPTAEFVCPHCGFEAKSAAGLKAHIKACKSAPDYVPFD